MQQSSQQIQANRIKLRHAKPSLQQRNGLRRSLH